MNNFKEYLLNGWREHKAHYAHKPLNEVIESFLANLGEINDWREQNRREYALSRKGWTIELNNEGIPISEIINYPMNNKYFDEYTLANYSKILMERK